MKVGDLVMNGQGHTGIVTGVGYMILAMEIGVETLIEHMAADYQLLVIIINSFYLRAVLVQNMTKVDYI